MNIANSKILAPVAVLALTVGPLSAVPAVAAGMIDLNFGAGTQGGSQFPVTVAIGQIIQNIPQLNSVTLQPGTTNATHRGLELIPTPV